MDLAPSIPPVSPSPPPSGSCTGEKGALGIKQSCVWQCRSLQFATAWSLAGLSALQMPETQLAPRLDLIVLVYQNAAYLLKQGAASLQPRSQHPSSIPDGMPGWQQCPDKTRTLSS